MESKSENVEFFCECSRFRSRASLFALGTNVSVVLAHRRPGTIHSLSVLLCRASTFVPLFSLHRSHSSLYDFFFSFSKCKFYREKNKILRARKWNPKRPTEGCAINWNMIDICSPDVRKVGLFGTNPNKRHIVVLLVVFFLFFFQCRWKIVECWKCCKYDHFNF